MPEPILLVMRFGDTETEILRLACRAAEEPNQLWRKICESTTETRNQIDDSASFDAVTVRHGIVKATLPGLKDERLWNMSTSCVV